MIGALMVLVLATAAIPALAHAKGGAGGGSGSKVVLTQEQLQFAMIDAVASYLDTFGASAGAPKDVKVFGIPGVDNNTLFSFYAASSFSGVIQQDPHRLITSIPAGAVFQFKGTDAASFFLTAERARRANCVDYPSCAVFLPVVPLVAPDTI